MTPHNPNADMAEETNPEGTHTFSILAAQIKDKQRLKGLQGLNKVQIKKPLTPTIPLPVRQSLQPSVGAEKKSNPQPLKEIIRPNAHIKSVPNLRFQAKVVRTP